VRVEGRSHDEVGTLIGSFNEMLGQIQAWDAELTAAKELLEQRVEERTKALQQEVLQRQQAQREAEERSAHLHALIQNSPLAIVVPDANGLISMCNPAFERLFQFGQQEILGRDLDTLIVPPELHEEGKTLSYQGRTEGKPVHAETRRRRRDGSLVDVEIYGVPLLSNGQLVGAYAMYQDITVRRKAEAEMRVAKEAAEEASRAKSEFLANMSHEIRTPMNGIMGMTELALDTDLNAEQREYLETVRSSADSLLSIINDILDFSKVEAGKLELDPLDFRLRECIADTLRPLALRAHQKGLELAYDIAPNVSDAVFGDPGRLRQVLVNLVGNAIKFTEQGEVVVTAQVEAASGETVQVHFAIRDTGMGIPASEQQRIFQAFTQADGSTTRRHGGTGLGLAIAARLIALMGGTIWVESTPGQGSTFHFTAQFGRLTDEMQETPRANLEKLQGLRVLVVDDNATNLRILTEMLNHWGVTPQPVSDGMAALALMRKAWQEGRPFELVVMDGHMPEMDGFEVVKRIRANPQLASATIMMLTSSGFRGDAARCRDLGISAYLVKPVRQAELLDSVLRVVGGQQRPASALLITRHTLRESAKSYRILVAEDNEVNQVFVRRLLSKAGHSVAVANNGREAVAAIEHGTFDVILMDVQMPEMGGLEATALIREHEKGTGQHLPIIAMTAHALRGDKERFLAAGMDGYVSKPARPDDLWGEIERCVAAHATPAAATASAPSDQPCVDAEALWDHLQNDKEALCELVELFTRDSQATLGDLQKAVQAGDAKAATEFAHKLKGMVGTFSARAAHELLSTMEAEARCQNLPWAREALPLLEGEMGRLRTALQAMVQESR
jgi:PAS domain S-box-containing protein